MPNLNLPLTITITHGNMENKIIKITPPEGFEIDKEKSTFEEIVFKPIQKPDLL